MYSFEKYSEIVQQPLEPVPWIVEGKVAEQDRTLFFAEWGCLKTWVTLGLCMDLASGRPWLGRFRVPRAFRVLYINEEDKRVSVRRRMKRLAMGMEMERADLPLRVLGRAGVRFNEEGLEELFRELDREGFSPEVVAVETFRAVSFADEVSAKEVREFWRDVEAFYERGKTLIITHHTRKPKPGFAESMRHRASGSTDIMANVDGAFSFQRQGKNSVLVSCEKLRDAEESDPFRVTLETDGEQGPVRLLCHEDPGATIPGAVQAAAEEAERFLATQERGTGATKDILRYLAAKGHAKKTGETALSNLCILGKVRRVRVGVYQRVEGLPVAA